MELLSIKSILNGGGHGAGVVFPTMAEMALVVEDGAIASCQETAYRGAWICDITLPRDPVTGFWTKITGANEIDLSDDLVDNEWNDANVNFLETPQLLKVGNKYILNAYIEMKSPISDIGAERIKILEVPHSTGKVNSGYCDLTNVGGYHTCEGNRHAFFDTDGSLYKQASDFNDTKKAVASIANVMNINPDTHEAKAAQRIKQADYSLMNDGDLPDFEKVVHQINSTGAVTTEGTPDPDNQYSFKFILPKTNMGYVRQVMENKDGWKTLKDVPCYKVQGVDIHTNPEYLMWVWRHQNGCNVDTQGKIGTYSFEKTMECAYFMKTDLFGYDGEHTFTPTYYDEETRTEPIKLESGEITTRAGITISKVLVSMVF